MQHYLFIYLFFSSCVMYGFNLKQPDFTTFFSRRVPCFSKLIQFSMERCWGLAVCNMWCLLSSQEGVSNRNVSQVCDLIVFFRSLFTSRWLLFNSALSCCWGTLLGGVYVQNVCVCVFLCVCACVRMYQTCTWLLQERSCCICSHGAQRSAQFGLAPNWQLY